MVLIFMRRKGSDMKRYKNFEEIHLVVKLQLLVINYQTTKEAEMITLQMEGSAQAYLPMYHQVKRNPLIVLVKKEHHKHL